MLDLTQTVPRSVAEKMLGIVQLARATDKAKAVAHGRVGEYHYDCPMDQGLFDFLGMDSKAFFNIVKDAKDDAEIQAYANVYVAKKDATSIEAFNKKWLSTVPTGESLTHFNELRAKIAPDRTDVRSWPDLLDLDEGRSVPKREPIHA
jgi:Domain of unknown function (DUF5069)